MISGDDAKSIVDSNKMDMLSFFKLLGKLKHLPRAGWVRHNVPQPETVACHMYRMAIMSFFLDDASSSSTKNENFSQIKCIKMALVHDMAECIVGDITPHDGISEEEKFRRENETMKHIQSLVPEKIGRELYQLWREYEAQETAEAKAVKDLDKFDMIMQAYEYETDSASSMSSTKKKSLQEFFVSAKDVFETSLVRDWAKQLNDERDQDEKKVSDEKDCA